MKKRARDSDKKHTVLVIDYGVGNVESVTNALRYLGYSYSVSSEKEAIRRADSYVLPGVGAFAEAMSNLKERGIITTLSREVLKKRKPLLGICLGMQVLADDSEEGGMHKGLGWIPGHIVRIPTRANIRVPHVGWNQVRTRKQKPLFSAIPKGARFYFDHSYHFATKKTHIAATCMYGTEITAAVQHGNIFGVQFHPEKSQNNGLRILRAFCEYAWTHPGASKK
ncbi:imidazole glycerol phosphate synthase, glutamine amidotransferase subunit [Candidatus Peribacteria bacterium RIFCSPHIGHO2_01_FULL_51_9]|nr:MAG: imidazole glycerol phosphate synthase, glutamine amidotransferase subunit [Candidatus Peribacteria bacterium RIFCSPHIGHO2_01_FULL_51_9]